jgi:predicted nucleic acid-binding protein
MNFWDASALVKVLDESEPGHDRASNLLRQKVRQASCILLPVEIASAIARRYADRPDARRQLRSAWEGLLPGIQLHAIDPLADGAALLAHRRRLRAADAIYLAVALDLRAELTRKLVFVTADRELAAAARAEGLRVVTPV